MLHWVEINVELAKRCTFSRQSKYKTTTLQNYQSEIDLNSRNFLLHELIAQSIYQASLYFQSLIVFLATMCP